MGESIVSKIVYQNCLILLTNRFSYVDLFKLHMLDFYVILGIDWLHASFSSIDCRTKVMKFSFPN